MELEEASEAGKDDFEASIAIVKKECGIEVSVRYAWRGEYSGYCVKKMGKESISLFPTFGLIFFLLSCGVEQSGGIDWRAVFETEKIN